MIQYVGPIERQTQEKTYCRQVLSTATYSQLVVMCLQPGEAAGDEANAKVDRCFRLEPGEAIFIHGNRGPSLLRLALGSTESPRNSLTSGWMIERGDVTMDSPTVLCIDDRPEILKLRKATLEFHNYCVKVASSGYTAMKILEEASVAAVLLEYKLEGMDAEAVAYHIKQRLPKLPIILLSAYSNMPERVLWLVDEYVLRSELPDGLVRVIERTLAPRLIDRCERKAAA